MYRMKQCSPISLCHQDSSSTRKSSHFLFCVPHTSNGQIISFRHTLSLVCWGVGGLGVAKLADGVTVEGWRLSHSTHECEYLIHVPARNRMANNHARVVSLLHACELVNVRVSLSLFTPPSLTCIFQACCDTIVRRVHCAEHRATSLWR